MAHVFIDNDIYKVSLEIVEDFINNDYDNFIQNEPKEDIRIIKWEMTIKFKLLENKNETIKKFYMFDFKNHLDYNLKSSGDYFYTLDFNGPRIDAIFINIQCNIKECFIKLEFYCDELYMIEKPNREIIYRDLKTEYCNYLSQMQYVFNGKIKSLFGNNKNDSAKYSHLSKLKDHFLFVNDELNIKFSELEYDDYQNTDLFKSIVENHYKNILANLDSYILYCKTENIDVDFKKITDRTRYIKEYVKKCYDISLV